MGAEVILHPVMTHTIDRDVDIAISHATSAMMQCLCLRRERARRRRQWPVLRLRSRQAARSTRATTPNRSFRSRSISSKCAARASAASGAWARWPRASATGPAEFPVYQQGFDTSYLDSLGRYRYAAPRRRRPACQRQDASRPAQLHRLNSFPPDHHPSRPTSWAPQGEASFKSSSR